MSNRGVFAVQYVAQHGGDAQMFADYLAEDPPLEEYTRWPLIEAVKAGHLRLAAMIVDKAGAAAFREVPHIVEIALREKRWDMTEYLVQKGAAPNLKDALSLNHHYKDMPLSTLQVLMEAEAPKVQKLYRETLVLAQAAQMANRDDIVDWLLSGPGIADNPRLSELFFFHTLDYRPSSLPVLKARGLWFEEDASHGTPLIRAIECHNPKGVEALLALGADPNGGAWQVPLVTAVAEKQEEIVGILLEGGADVFSRQGGALRYARHHPEEAGILQKLEAALQAQSAHWRASFDGADLAAAAKGGLFPALAGEFAAEGRRLRSTDIACASGHDTPIACILELRGEQDSLLDCRLWADPAADLRLIATSLWDTRRDFEAKAEAALEKARSDENLQKLKKNAATPRFRL